MATSLNPDIRKVGESILSIPYDYGLAYSMVRTAIYIYLTLVYNYLQIQYLVYLKSSYLKLKLLKLNTTAYILYIHCGEYCLKRLKGA